MSAGASRFAMLDGWRAVSILLVLAGHLLPLGPHVLDMNETIAATGMVFFFILSGFLIVRFLSETTSIRVFIIRRFFRIVPVAWVAMTVALVWSGDTADAWAANLLFYANLPPFWLQPAGGHLWSLCVEMQFYVGIAILVAVAGRRALVAVPALCLGVTLARVMTGTETSIVTWFRIDEILAGGTLALAYGGWFGDWPERWLRRVNVYLMLPLIVASAHPWFGPLNYLRPYLAMLTVGATLYHPPRLLERLFTTRAMAYIASTSYAIYVIHGLLSGTWLGTGDRLVRYAKRPLLFGATFALAHASTFWFERPCIALAKRLTHVPPNKDVA